MMKTYFSSWNILRVLRLVAGVFIIGQGIVTRDWIFAGAGVLFSLMPIFNIGCCAASGCKTPVRKTGNTEEITYEEVR